MKDLYRERILLTLIFYLSCKKFVKNFNSNLLYTIFFENLKTFRILDRESMSKFLE